MHFVFHVNTLNKTVMNTRFSSHYSLVKKRREIIKQTKLLSQTSEIFGSRPGKILKKMKATVNIIHTAI